MAGLFSAVSTPNFQPAGLFFSAFAKIEKKTPLPVEPERRPISKAAQETHEVKEEKLADARDKLAEAEAADAEATKKAEVP